MGQAYAEDLERTDALGTSVTERVNMYNPMYYLEDYYEGYQSAEVADSNFIEWVNECLNSQ